MKDELVMLARAQLTLCRQLIALGERQRGFILKKLRSEMYEVVKEQESVFHKFMQIEGKKQRLLAKVKNEAPRKGEKAPETPEDKSEAYARELSRELRELRRINRENERLLENEVRFVDFNINIMTQTTADDIYAPQGGQGGSVISKKKMFDQTI